MYVRSIDRFNQMLNYLPDWISQKIAGNFRVGAEKKFSNTLNRLKNRSVE